MMMDLIKPENYLLWIGRSEIPLDSLVYSAGNLDVPIESWLSLIERCIRNGGEEQLQLTDRKGVRSPSLSASKDYPYHY